MKARAATHAAAGHGGGHATAAVCGRASVCGVEVSHLRPSALSAARPRRSADGNELGNAGVQPETNDEGAGRRKLAGGPGRLSGSGPATAQRPSLLEKTQCAKPIARTSRKSGVL